VKRHQKKAPTLNRFERARRKRKDTPIPKEKKKRLAPIQIRTSAKNHPSIASQDSIGNRKGGENEVLGVNEGGKRG